MFQSCRDRAIASWVLPVLLGVKCLAQGHNTAEVGFEPPDLTLCAPLLLAHLSQRLIGELIGYPWSGVLRRRPSTISNVFSSETAWPIKAKFYVEPSWQGGKKFI